MPNQDRMDLITAQKAMTIKKFLDKPEVQEQFLAAMPDEKEMRHFLRVCFTEIRRNPRLAQCTQASLMSAMMAAAQLRLEPTLGKAALIAYGQEAQFQPMYKGLLELAWRTGRITISTNIVYEGEEFDWQEGAIRKLYHKPARYQGQRGEKLLVYTVWRRPEHRPEEVPPFTVMLMEDVYHVRDTHSSAWKSGKKDIPWITDENEMIKKTALNRHSKTEPCSIEMQTAVELSNLSEAGLSQADTIADLISEKARKIFDLKSALPETTPPDDEEPPDQPKTLKALYGLYPDIAQEDVDRGVAAAKEEFEASEEEVVQNAFDNPIDFRGYIYSKKTEEPKSSPAPGKDMQSSHKTEPPDDLDQWILRAKRSTAKAYPKWFMNHYRKFEGAPADVIQMLREKWDKCKTGKMFPFNSPVVQKQETIDIPNSGPSASHMDKQEWTVAMMAERSRIGPEQFDKALAMCGYELLAQVKQDDMQTTLDFMQSVVKKPDVPPPEQITEKTGEKTEAGEIYPYILDVITAVKNAVEAGGITIKQAVDTAYETAGRDPLELTESEYDDDTVYNVIKDLPKTDRRAIIAQLKKVVETGKAETKRKGDRDSTFFCNYEGREVTQRYCLDSCDEALRSGCNDLKENS